VQYRFVCDSIGSQVTSPERAATLSELAQFKQK